jgi:hypothetical protein
MTGNIDPLGARRIWDIGRVNVYCLPHHHHHHPQDGRCMRESEGIMGFA